MKKAIIFDLYGTLIEIHNKTNPYLYLLSHLKEDSIVKSNDIISQIVMKDILNIGFLKLISESNCLKDTFDSKMFIRLLEEEVESIRAYDDTYDVLNRLKSKYRLFVLSNLSTPYKYPYYRLNMENYIERPFFSCDEGERKPNSNFFNKIINYTGLNVNDFIMIGDNFKSDIQGAINIGMDAILKDKSLSMITKHL